MKYVCVITEGPQDVSFLGRILKRQGFSSAKTVDQVPDFWKRLIPTKYPFEGSSLSRLAPTPEFYTSEDADLSYAIIAAGGDGKVISCFQRVSNAIDVEKVHAFSIFVDADEKGASKRLVEITLDLQRVNKESQEDDIPGFPINIPVEVGGISSGSPKLGVFVFPDNKSQGSLEDLLLSCARKTHSEVSPIIERSIDRLVANSKYRKLAYLKTLRKASSAKKASTSVFANLLKPGSSLAVAIHQGGWICEGTFDVPEVITVSDFMKELGV